MPEAINWTERTPIHSLPLLFAGQAQKEITHNETLALIDVLLVPTVEGGATSPDALNPEQGMNWLVAAPATGEWEGLEGQLACWTAGGWRYVPGVEAMRIYDRSAQALRIYANGTWLSGAIIMEPTGGTTVDGPARSAIGEIIQLLQQFGLAQPAN